MPNIHPILPDILTKAELETVFPQTWSEVVGLLECTDYYLAHRTDTPKFTIGNYVDEEIQKDPEEFQSLKVPRRFYRIKNGEKVSCHKEATKSWVPFKARSEHEQDYDGISWLLETFDFAAWEEVDERKLMEDTRNNARLITYCKLQNINIDEFMKGVSFSYWEDIPGRNVTIVRDEVVEKRYHVFMKNGFWNYHVCIDSGKITLWSLLYGIKLEQVLNLIEYYKNISRLHNFDPFQYPNIEFQLWSNGKDYFLQYKRGHQKKLDTWILSRELNPLEIEADFVRWSTMEWWEVFDLDFNDAKKMMYTGELTHNIKFWDYIKMKLPVCIGFWEDGDYDLDSHGISAQICHSEVYVYIDIEPFKNLYADFFSLQQFTLFQFTEEGLDKVKFKVHIEADGNKGYIKFVESYDEFYERVKWLWYDMWRLENFMKQYRWDGDFGIY